MGKERATPEAGLGQYCREWVGSYSVAMVVPGLEALSVLQRR